MIGAAIGDTLAFAAGIALSPIPIIAVIIILFTPRARANGPAFVAGWIAGLLAVTMIAATVADGAGADSDEGTNDAVDWIKVILGMVFLFLAYKQWLARPGEGEEEAMPGWMASVDALTPAKSLGLGALLAINPKNLVLAVGAGASIGQTTGLGLGETVAAVVVFAALASVTTAGAVAYYLLGGENAQAALDRWRVWLTRNNAVIMAVILLILGIALVGQGIRGIAD